MKRALGLAGIALAAALAGCATVEFEPGHEDGSIGPVEADARRSCVNALRQNTGAAVAINSSTYSASGTVVLMRAMPDQDWTCTAASDGTVTNLELVRVYEA